jgi:beta-glucosidase
MAHQLFPRNFLWGASTAAHQVEGNMHNQWSEWERANASRLADTFSKRFAWLPNVSEIETAGKDPENYISGRGVDHYDHYKADFAILTQLHMNAFRFSIEWSRIEPTEGVWDEQAVAHYHAYISELKRLDIEPVLTLWHWTMPVWFTNKGGFDRFVRKIAEEFGSELHYVITLNEPNVYTVFGYGTGEWPPAIKNPIRALSVYRHLVLAHRRAYVILKHEHPMLQVGVAMAMSAELSSGMHDVVGNAVARITSYVWNYWFVDRIGKKQDFVGVNYYATNHHRGLKRYTPATSIPKNDMGWDMEPRQLEHVLRAAWLRYGKPIIITENGLADAKDAHRTWWLQETIVAMQRALEHGVDLRGYMHWSLLDNFEWAYGWWPKFGLVAVDRETMRRTIRQSAHAFAAEIKRLRR